LDTEQCKTPLQVAQALMIYFQDHKLNSQFHVAGYDYSNALNPIPMLYAVKTKENKLELFSDKELEPVLAYSCANSTPELFFPFVAENLKSFSVQDAVDFSVFVMKTTQSLFRFQGMAEIVGGPIDVLAIKTDGAEWVSRKTLHV
jgi:hypothetical protein